MSEAIETDDVQLSIDYGQFYLSGESAIATIDPPPELAGLDDAQRSGRGVGQASGLIVVQTPVQFHFDAPLRVEVWAEEPPLGDDDSEHVVDVDLDAPHGAVYFWELPNPEVARECAVPAGRYRARIGGAGYDAARATSGVEGGADTYSVRLWPRDVDREPELRRAWFGWADAHVSP